MYKSTPCIKNRSNEPKLIGLVNRGIKLYIEKQQNKEKNMYSYLLLMVNSIFCCELCVFFTFTHVSQIYVVEILIKHFWQVLISKVFIIYLSNKVRSILGGFHVWIHLQFCLSQCYLLSVYISHIFYFSGAILIALNDNLELTVLCRLWDFLKDQIDMCFYSLMLVNSIFWWELCFFLTFS